MANRESGDEIPLQQELATSFGDVDRILNLESTLFRNGFGVHCKINDVPLEQYSNSKIIADKILAMHKLLFLTGGDEDNVLTAKDPYGNYIYTKRNNPDLSSNWDSIDLVHIGEVSAALSALSFYGKYMDDSIRNNWQERFKSEFIFSTERVHNLTTVFSTIAAVNYNLINLASLDPAYDYKRWVDYLSGEFGFELKHTLDLVIQKYRFRYETNKGKIDFGAENALILQMVRDGVLPIELDGDLPKPTWEQLGRCYHGINRINRGILLPRLKQLEYELMLIVGRSGIR